MLIATGVYKARDIAAPGVGLPGIAAGARLSHRRRTAPASATSVPDVRVGRAATPTGKNVVVIGGGDTAMDCVRTAVRQGAKSVKCLYRRDRANMPGSQREVKQRRGGGRRVRLALRAAGIPRQGDKVSHVRSVRIHLGMPDASGRQAPQEIANSHVNIEADLVLKALGFDPEDLPALLGAPDLGVTGWGTLKIDWRAMMTSLDGVFAAGDIVRGASLVVWAVRDGRDAAERIHSYLTSKAQAALADRSG